MYRQMIWAAVVAVIPAVMPEAAAQFYGDGCNSCGGRQSYSAPAYSASSGCVPVASCTPIQPVYSACYQTVPVTTYKREQQTVEVPYYKTEYEDREVTTYVPVSQQRTVEVPTVSYRTVQQNRVVHRDMGRWVTNYQPTGKCSSCQVDPRPGMIGWLNRTGYSFRSAFVPNYRTSRQYVPQMMACNVPVTRQVAVRGTQKVTYNETRMVAKRTTEKVAVQKLAYRKEQVTVARPVTAYRTVPIGSALAYGGYGFGRSGMAFIESDDTQTALRPKPDAGIDDASLSERPFSEDVRSSDLKNSKTDQPFRGSSFSSELKPVDTATPQPPFPDDGKRSFQGFDDTRRSTPTQVRPASHSTERPIVLGGWRASRNSADQTASTDRRTVPSVVLKE